jgi:multidrug efflux pump subunit AcrA (membrane-fusion protein)
MISTGLMSILWFLGIASGASSGWYFSRRNGRRVERTLREFGPAYAKLVEETEGIIENELDGMDLRIQEIVQRQVSLAMSEVLAAMAQAEQQKIAYAQAQAQAEELARLRAAASRPETGFGSPAGNVGQSTAQAIAEMNERMAGIQEKMRRAGMPAPGDR